MIGWGPHQYAPIHDHPKLGCLQTILKGPGLYESFFKKSSKHDRKTECDKSLKDESSEISDSSESSESSDSSEISERKSIGSRMIINMTGIYECHSNLKGYSIQYKKGCEEKRFTKACLTELYSVNRTLTENLVSFVKGYNLMHYVQNLNNDHTLGLYHYLGDYHISWWLNRKVYEHESEFLFSTP